MFSRKERASKATFEALKSKGRRISSVHFSIAVPSEGYGYAVVVSKKTARLAITRRRLKRRVIAALRALTLPPTLIVFPKLSVLDLEFEAIKAELVTLIAHITSGGHAGKK